MLQRDREWFRVEVSDHDGQIVAIEPEMLAGRDIGEVERKKIHQAIEHLQGFVGPDNPTPFPIDGEPLCSDCPPFGHPTNKTRCAECPRMETDPVLAGINEMRDSRGLQPFPVTTHWSKDPLVPYAGCNCSSCNDARCKSFVADASDGTATNRGVSR
jgi:ribosomal protein L34E